MGSGQDERPDGSPGNQLHHTQVNQGSGCGGKMEGI